MDVYATRVPIDHSAVNALVVHDHASPDEVIFVRQERTAARGKVVIILGAEGVRSKVDGAVSCPQAVSCGRHCLLVDAWSGMLWLDGVRSCRRCLGWRHG